MRSVIWRKTDYLGAFDNRVILNLDGVITESELPLCYNYDHVRPPIGKVTDIRIKDGEITGEVELFEHAESEFPNLQPDGDGHLLSSTHAMQEPLRYRLAIYANSVEYNESKTIAQSCVFREISLIPEQAWPESETTRG